MKKEKFLLNLSNLYMFIGILLVVVSIGVFLIPTVPYIVYNINPKETEKEIETLTEEFSTENINTEVVEEDILPPVDLSLPTKPYIRIPSIGINSPISAEQDYISALRNGTWMVPEFGSPMNGKTPIILAAHRFGYKSWTKETRNVISFYNLPKTKNGDIIEIIWEQRKFRYMIYAEGEGTYITDYNADLILYTCKFFNTPVRIFRYANLIESTAL
ncbi:MAG: sortase [Candidatus Dojkabacteria bacterium]